MSLSSSSGGVKKGSSFRLSLSRTFSKKLRDKDSKGEAVVNSGKEVVVANPLSRMFEHELNGAFQKKNRKGSADGVFPALQQMNDMERRMQEYFKENRDTTGRRVSSVGGRQKRRAGSTSGEESAAPPAASSRPHSPLPSPSVSPRKKLSSKAQKKHLVESVLSSTSPTVARKVAKDFRFGVPLDSMVEHGREIPLLVLKLASNLREDVLTKEGLFFFDVQDKQELQTLRVLIEKGKAEISGIQDPHVVAALIKLFFTELPEPLLTFNLYDSFIITTEIDIREYRISALRSLVFSLPRNNRIVLQYLLSILKKVVKQSEKNLVPVEKMAKVFGSILLRPIQHQSMYATHPNEECPKVVQFLMEDYEHIFMVTEEEGIKFLLDDGYPVVKGGTMKALIRQLVDDNYKDPDYQDIMVHTHTYFTTTPAFLEQIIETFTLLGRGGTTVWRDKARISMLKFIKYWISQDWVNLRKIPEFVDKISAFSNSSKELNRLQPQIETYLTSDKKLRELEESTKRKNSFGSTLHATAINLLEYSPLDIARQMTLIEHSLFSSLDLKECLKKCFMNPPESPTFSAFASKFNEWCLWVATEIAKREFDARIEAITFMIKVAEFCKEMNNFSCVFAILAGLNLSSISRMKKTWAKIPKQTMVRYHKLMELCDMSKNYSNYRTDLKKAQLPAIPYMAMFTKYLFSIEENNPNQIGDLTNLNKMRMIYNVMKQIQDFQSGSYDFQQMPQLLSSLSHLDVLDEQSLFTLSLKSEPRDDKKETITKNPVHMQRTPRKSRSSSGAREINHIPEEEEETDYREQVPSDTEQKKSELADDDSCSGDDDQLVADDFQDLEMVLGYAPACALFEKYLESKNAQHLLDFLRDVEAFVMLSIDDPTHLPERANQIYQKYFSGKEATITIEEDLMQQIHEQAKFEVFNVDSFTHAEAAVFTILETSYFSSFTSSKDFEEGIKNSAQWRRLSGAEIQMELDLIADEEEKLQKEEEELHRRMSQGSPGAEASALRNL